MRKPKTAEKAHELGENHNNRMKNKNGLDEIDLWAMNVGNAERSKKEITPERKHLYC